MNMQLPPETTYIHPAGAGLTGGFIGSWPGIVLVFGGVHVTAGLDANGALTASIMFSLLLLLLGSLGGMVRGWMLRNSVRSRRTGLWARATVGGLRSLLLEALRGAVGGSMVGVLVGWFWLPGGWLAGVVYGGGLGAAAGAVYGAWQGAVRAGIEERSQALADSTITLP